MQAGERGLPQLQEEGPQPAEVPREGPPGQALRLRPVERTSPEVPQGDGRLCRLHVLLHQRI